MWSDLRFTVRTLLRQPLFAAVVVLTLALGIGGSTAIFSVVNAVLLRDLPYPDPDQLYLVRSMTPDGMPTGNIRPPELRPFYDADEHPTVQAAAIGWSQGVQIVGADGRSNSTIRYGVTDQFFEVFGTEMALGQPFHRGDDPGTIVLAYSIWRDLFGSDPDIIGRTVTAEGRPMQVVGVARAEFEFPENPGYLVLMRLGPGFDRSRSYRGFVRLKPGHSEAELMTQLTSHVEEVGPDPVTGRPTSVVVRPFLDYVVGDLSATVMILFGGTVILLLIACINVTNLLLSRATARSREMALREAVGAGRWRVIRHLLTESLVLSVAGGVLGLAGAAAALRILLGMAPPDLPRLDDVPIDRAVLFFAVGASVLTGILVGLAPAWRLATNPLRNLMNEGGRGATARHRLFSALVVTEIALAVLLVIGAGLLVRSYLNLTATDPGFNPARVLTAFMYVSERVSVWETTDAQGKPQFDASYAPMATFYSELEDRLRALPGVAAVTSTTTLPLEREQYNPLVAFRLDGQASGDSVETAETVRTRSVGPGFFSTMEIRVTAGRDLLASDRAGSPGVAVVNQAFVRRHLQGQAPLGRRIRYLENRWVPRATGFQLSHRTVDEVEIVGVVEDVKSEALAEPAEPVVYMSRDQWTNRRQTIVIRSAVDNPESLVATVRREIEAMDPLQATRFATYTSVTRASIAAERLAATLLFIFGAMAMTLAAIGVYGLMSYSVAQQSGEMAVRSAMGASPGQVLGLVMRRGTVLAAAGIVLGIAGAATLRQVIASQLFGVAPLDASVFAMSSLLLLGVAALACFVPAHRASKIHPARLLQSD